MALAVLVQHAAEYGDWYPLECLRHYPDPLACVMLIGPGDGGTQVRRWAAM